MKNTISDLSNYLFEQLERLNDDDLSAEELEKEIRKTDSIVKVSQQIIQTGELAFKTMQHMDEFGYNLKPRPVPVMLQAEDDNHGN